MKTRQVAVTVFRGHVGEDNTLYSVNVRHRCWGFLWWSKWKHIQTFNDKSAAWDYNQARLLADQCLANGWIARKYYEYVYPIIELDQETSDA